MKSIKYLISINIYLTKTIVKLYNLEAFKLNLKFNIFSFKQGIVLMEIQITVLTFQYRDKNKNVLMNSLPLAI